MIRCKPALAAVVVSALSFAAGAAHATTFDVTGTWSTTLDGEGYTAEPFTGSASFSYSDDTITGSGLEDLLGALTAFSLSPNPLGVTTFDLSNTGFFVRYNEGALYQIIVGGTIGTVPGAAQNTDDFYVVEFVSSTDVIAVSAAASSTTIEIQFEPDVTVDFTVTAVPEPAGLALLVSGLPILARCGRRPWSNVDERAASRNK